MKDSTIKLIINALRQATITWEGRKQCLKDAQVIVDEGLFKNGKPKLKAHWKCAKCQKLFRDQKEMEVDHIDQIGSFKGSWDAYIPRMFCDHDLSNLQALCVSCHLQKTLTVHNASKKFTRKKK